VSRRRLLQGLALSSFGLAGVSGARRAGAADPAVDLESPAGLLTSLVRMRGSLDERLVYIWLRGLRYTLVDGEALPLCGYLGGSITRYRRLADDMFEFVLYEVSYYTDIDTGEVLETLRMPYTGADVAVPLYRTGPGRHVIMMANEEALEGNREKTTSDELARQIAPDAKINYRFRVRPAVSFEGSTWIRNDSFTRLAGRCAGPHRHLVCHRHRVAAVDADGGRERAHRDGRHWRQGAGHGGHAGRFPALYRAASRGRAGRSGGAVAVMMGGFPAMRRRRPW
jgi:hypothetical protein